jgi:hypothetical protein
MSVIPTLNICRIANRKYATIDVVVESSIGTDTICRRIATGWSAVGNTIVLINGELMLDADVVG